MLLIGYVGYQNRTVRESVLGEQGTWVPEIMQNKIEVRLASVTVQQGRSADAVVVATGYLESRRQARIGARAAGRINAVLFEEGDKVGKGAPSRIGSQRYGRRAEPRPPHRLPERRRHWWNNKC